MKKNIIIFLTLVLAFFILPLQVWSMEMLSDEQMDTITAGNNDPGDQNGELLTRIPFNYSSSNGVVDGEVLFLHRTTFNQTGILTLMDNAQSNLNSLINVNAVNSQVQVLLNLNISINSTIENLGQWNTLMPGR